MLRFHPALRVSLCAVLLLALSVFALPGSQALAKTEGLDRAPFVIEEGSPAPVPAAEGFQSFAPEEADQVLAFAQRAYELGLMAADEPLCFRTDVEFVPGSVIHCYCDESILVICWKELIDGNTCSFVETRIGDGSQLRRKFVNDTFGDPNQYYASEIAAGVNAVVAMNADYYLFRDLGIVVYDRQLYRMDFTPYGDYQKYNCIENCFVTAEGDFLFSYKGQEWDEESLRQYLADNDILFSIAFGPVLVDQGELRVCDGYPMGEVGLGYSRAGIGQLGKLHYLYMSLNHSPQKEARWTVNTFAQHFWEKGVWNAYCLDGGQTSEIVMLGQPYNYIDFGKERTVSDILYFATSVPNDPAAEVPPVEPEA